VSPRGKKIRADASIARVCSIAHSARVGGLGGNLAQFGE
jgi:hypothetical protein